MRCEIPRARFTDGDRSVPGDVRAEVAQTGPERSRIEVDFGDGEGRNLEFGVADKRTVRHVYRKGGDFRIAAKGAGKTPCEGSRETTLSVKGPVTEKKKSEEKKKTEKKKAEKKKADRKPASKKKEKEEAK